MAEPIHCKHCKPEEQGTYLLPGPFRNLYHYYDHLGVDHDIVAKRHFYTVQGPNGETVTVGEAESIQEATERLAALKDSLQAKKANKGGRANK